MRKTIYGIKGNEKECKAKCKKKSKDSLIEVDYKNIYIPNKIWPIY